MSEPRGHAPRRALPPIGDEPGEVAPDDASGGEAQGDPVPGDGRGEATAGSAPRRGLWSPTGSPPDSAGPGATLIPPPATLPLADVPGPLSGRRFSADELPDDPDRPLPRRSALSPADGPGLSPASPPSAAEQADDDTPRSRRTIGLVGAGVGVVVLVAALIWGPGIAGQLGATPTPTIDPVATYLTQPDDLTGVRQDSTWNEESTSTTVDATTPLPRCLLPAAEQTVKPDSTLVRTFTPADNAAVGILHQVERFATLEQAQQAYASRLTQLAGCERTTGLAVAGLRVGGLSDEAAGLTLMLQNTENEYHTIVISRTGDQLNVVDATAAGEPVPAEPLIAALATVSARQCTAGGLCPTAAEVAPSAPLPVAPEGWLASVDLPRINPGAGAWRGTDVSPTVTTTGTRCEAVDLTTAGSERHQRTYLLRDDAAAPAQFGVDQVTYAFETADEAGAFHSALASHLDECTSRSNTAQVTRGADLSSAHSADGRGTAWSITQKTDQAAGTAHYRVAVVTSGTHVAYLMANPAQGFDFSDESWNAVGARAIERIEQLP
ncbi:MAG: hypothetical protein IPL36_09395 [Nigerium sp.]|nr:hypothetical protein [Nigerium sp.]